MKKTPPGDRAGDEANNADDRVSFEETTGFVGNSAAVCKAGNDGRDADSPDIPEAVPAPWMSQTLIEKTHGVWEKRYGRALERTEVLEILHNIRWFGELLRRGLQGGTL